ncbi:hypothetical protein ASPBRDRAFT_669219 [Aspergillus brasiliensis CBS 101740]|uniref:Uncharacterized protein n=1 Tax=Aspergillus brasiliensis (strain CBS 101740 / IMI 381727 / IBT 21946) TaxID=767769 RepID=A0A1L9UU35_ASPBC|nr:hypothetical protein ASPBRDRAFT_669219 [Aspergillus brasiliensis CBS 101740]
MDSPTPNYPNPHHEQTALEVTDMNLSTTETPPRIPEGWTNRPADLKGWFEPGSGETYLARCHGLKDVSLVLTTTPETGELRYIITSNKVYYIGNLMDEHIHQIIKPTTWPDILATLSRSGGRDLTTKKLELVDVPEDERPRDDEVIEGRKHFVPA